MTSLKRIIDWPHKHFRTLALLTVITVYLLVLIGGIVRSTGSGMGCPDWPKCFGMWVPPTEASQLPHNYQEIFGAKLKGEVEFNATKTWIEYVNRLFGVLTGFFIFGTLIAAIPFLRKDKPVFYMSLLAFLLVSFQGWLGSKVVSSELAPWLVTLHMMLALIIVFVLLYVMARSYAGFMKIEDIANKKIITNWLIVILLVSLLQISLGTQVREIMDEVMRSLGNENRDKWIEGLGVKFYVHRSFSIIILGLHLFLIYILRKNTGTKSSIYTLTTALLGVIVVEILTGVILAYFSVPAFAQPMHLTLASIAVGIQFVIILLVNADRVFRKYISEVNTILN